MRKSLVRIYCDRCKNEICPLNTVTIEIITGSEMDASGNGYSDIVKKIDLCPECATKSLTTAFCKKLSGDDLVTCLIGKKK